MTELKACPFCGGTDIRCSFEVTGKFLRHYRVAMFCNDCRTHGPIISTLMKTPEDYSGLGAITEDEKYEAEATEAWNRRVEYGK